MSRIEVAYILSGNDIDLLIPFSVNLLERRKLVNLLLREGRKIFKNELHDVCDKPSGFTWLASSKFFLTVLQSLIKHILCTKQLRLDCAKRYVEFF